MRLLLLVAVAPHERTAFVLRHCVSVGDDAVAPSERGRAVVIPLVHPVKVVPLDRRYPVEAGNDSAVAVRVRALSRLLGLGVGAKRHEHEAEPARLAAGCGSGRRQEMEQAARGHDLRAVEGRQARRHRRQAREPHYFGVHGHVRNQAQTGCGGRAQDRGVQAALAPGSTSIVNGRRVFKEIKGEHSADSGLAKVNPNFKTKRDKDGRYSYNCQRCVPAYGARRRGPDVVANPIKMSKWGKYRHMTPSRAESYKKAFPGATWKRGSDKPEKERLC